jgi:hypothetical protein
MRIPQCDQWEMVWIEWADSNGDESGWHKVQKIEMEIHGCTTVGQVYAQDKDRITVALSVDHGSRGKRKTVNGILTIPTCATTDFAILKKVSPRSSPA